MKQALTLDQPPSSVPTDKHQLTNCLAKSRVTRRRYYSPHDTLHSCLAPDCTSPRISGCLQPFGQAQLYMRWNHPYAVQMHLPCSLEQFPVQRPSRKIKRAGIDHYLCTYNSNILADTRLPKFNIHSEPALDLC